MMHGLVNVNYEPMLRLEIENDQHQVQKIDVVINTAFPGYLGLPRPLITDLNLARLTPNDNHCPDESYTAIITWNEEYRRIPVIPVETEPMVGMALLQGHTLQIQVIQHGLVTLERAD